MDCRELLSGGGGRQGRATGSSNNETEQLEKKEYGAKTKKNKREQKFI